MPDTKLLSDRLPDDARAIVERLERAGHHAWCVGGAVRDGLLGLAPKDWDIATDAHPEIVMGLFRRTIPTGLAHGTVTVLGEDREGYEITTFRRDVSTDGRHATVAFASTIEEDLARRDFTCNAMAWSPTRDELLDPYAGAQALAAKELHTVGDPEERFAEDRLRVVRALRFAGRFDLRIGDQTWDAMQASAPHLHPVSVERFLQEWQKTLEQIRHPSHTFRLWERAGVFAHRFPRLQDIAPTAWPALDVLGGPAHHPMPTGWRADLRFCLPFATLGADRAKHALTDLRASSQDIRRTMHLATQLEQWRESLTVWLTPTDTAPQQAAPEITGTHRQFLAAVGQPQVKSVLRAHQALATAETIPASGPRLAPRVAAPLPPLAAQLLKEAKTQPLTLQQLAITGRDLAAAGWKPGPGVGDTLQRLLAHVIADPTRNTPDQLLALAGPPPAIPPRRTGSATPPART